ncbi:hypothetical protein Tco_1002081 [Tanacetum coccineum]|uniref:Uncharacterized protein n=1 Tax=Tanacetum coccineum TaxID=301880 RepID=A0ABQ5F6R5_9ASTR
MALPNKDQLKFHQYKDVKFLMEAIEKRYGGNKESNKAQRTLLKQQYENFRGLSSEIIDQTFDRLQKLIGQLEVHGEVLEQEGINLKLLRSLPSEWKTHALIWRNKQEIETISLDDLYNNLKIYEPEISGSSNNTTYGVSAANTQSILTSGDNLSDAVICAFLARSSSSSDSEVIDKFKMEQDIMAALLLNPSPAVKSFVNLSEMLENQEYNKSKSDKGYHAVPLPLQRISYFANMI